MAVAAILALSCQALFTTAIGEVLDNPAKYEGRTVAIDGEVRGSTNLLVLRYYKVKDATGEITVVTQKAVPREGARVHVRGVVHQAFAIAGQSLTVLTESAED